MVDVYFTPGALAFLLLCIISLKHSAKMAHGTCVRLVCSHGLSQK